MRWGLLISDALARLIGLTGMIIAAVFFVGAFHGLTGDATYLRHNAGAAIFMMCMAVIFLLPRLHDRMMRRTLHVVLRVPFVLLCLIWAATIAAGLWVLSQVASGAPDAAQYAVYWPLIAVATALALAVVVFPFGLGYSEARASKEAGIPLDEPPPAPKAPHDLEAKVEYRVAEAKRPPEDRFGADGLPHRGMLDYLAWVPMIVVLIAGMLALRYGDTVQTPGLNAYLDLNWLALAVMTGFALFIPVAIAGLIRRWRGAEMVPVGAARGILGVVVTPILLGATVFAMAAYDLFPWAWNRMTDNPEATAVYEVTDIRLPGQLQNCVRLRPSDQPSQGMMHCGMDGALVTGLDIGDRIEATGELSDFAHSFESVRVLR